MSIFCLAAKEAVGLGFAGDSFESVLKFPTWRSCPSARSAAWLAIYAGKITFTSLARSAWRTGSQGSVPGWRLPRPVATAKSDDLPEQDRGLEVLRESGPLPPEFTRPEVASVLHRTLIQDQARPGAACS